MKGVFTFVAVSRNTISPTALYLDESAALPWALSISAGAVETASVRVTRHPSGCVRLEHR